MFSGFEWHPKQNISKSRKSSEVGNWSVVWPTTLNDIKFEQIENVKFGPKDMSVKRT